MENINIKCNRCKHYKNADEFKKNGKVLKCCMKCRINAIKNINKNRCIHGIQKNQCIKCNGSSICVHKKQKNFCIECNGSSLCEHKKQKSRCKICSDELEITIINMIRGSKHKDKKYNRYDIVNFIDKSFLKKLINDSENKCYYCKCQLQYIVRQQNLASIERLDNNIGHVKSNCVIACLHCNVSRGERVGNKLN